MGEEQKLIEELSPNRRNAVGERLGGVNREKALDQLHLVLLLMDMGFRYSEAAELTWDRVNLDERTIRGYRSKVNNESVLSITDRVREALTLRAEKKGPEDVHVFQAPDGKGPRRYRTDGISPAIERARLNTPEKLRARGKITVHSLRHHYASKLAQAGVSFQTIAYCLGHSETAMSARYAHLIPNEAAKTARDVIERLNGKNVSF